MNKQRVLMFFGAHPDDETFGIGSTLTQYADSGVKVYYVIIELETARVNR